MRLLLIAAMAAGVVATTLSPAVAGESPTVEVLDPGTEPRTALRLDVHEGDEVALTLGLHQRIEQVLEGDALPVDPIPEIRQELVATVENVTRRGRISYSFEVGDVKVVGDETFDQEFVDNFEELLEPLTELRGEVTVTRRGVQLGASLDVPEGAPTIVEDLLTEFAQQLSILTIPYPREPVGVGARWTTATELTSGGIDTEVVYEYELREIRGSDLVIGLTFTQTARPQDVDLPGLPEGGEVRLVDYLVEGTGTSTGALTAVVPVESTVSAGGDQRFRLELEDEERELRQSTLLEVTVSPGT